MVASSTAAKLLKPAAKVTALAASISCYVGRGGYPRSTCAFEAHSICIGITIVRIIIIGYHNIGIANVFESITIIIARNIIYSKICTSQFE